MASREREREREREEQTWADRTYTKLISFLAFIFVLLTPTICIARPNIVLFIVDDMTMKDMDYLPGFRSISAQGVQFSQFATPTPSCDESRSSLLRGQYSHNMYALGRSLTASKDGLDEETIAVWLSRGGYKTGLFGKYMAGYNPRKLYVPPGWTEWYGGDGKPGYDFSLNENGTLVNYAPPGPHKNDRLAQLAKRFIRRHYQDPMFIYIASNSPHNPPIPADRHKEYFLHKQMPTGPNYFEQDVSDKPYYVRKRKPFMIKPVEELEQFRNRLRTLLSVQYMIQTVVASLTNVGVLDNTYFIFMSDNGWGYGEHRFQEQKLTPYAYSNIVPAWIWGPGIPAGVTRDHLVANSDIALTIAEWAEVLPAKFVDGRSLVPVVAPNPVPLSEWRQALPISFTQDVNYPFPFLQDTWPPSYFGLLAASGDKVVHYVTGEEELYVDGDIYEMNSQHGNPSAVARKKRLLKWAQELNSCAAAKCRTLDIAPSTSTSMGVSVTVD